jgi:hypothetical protein
MLLRTLPLVLSVAAGLASLSARAADDEAALDLQIEEKPAVARPGAGPGAGRAPDGRLSVELALGAQDHRFRGETLSTHRLSVDFRRSWSLAPGWRFSLSDRLDQQRAIDDGDRSTVNSLREAYVAWQQSGDDPWAVDIGRLQWRNGPAFGFNPTDFLRQGSLRTFTTADPIALRENRLGTVMLRVQKLWAGGAVSLALAPKLEDAPSSGSFNLDLGSTNASNRLLATWSPALGQRWSGQFLWLAEQGEAPRFGASGTALFSDAVVGFAEWAGGRQPDRFAALAGTAAPARWRNQLATGATLSLPGQVALTLEFDVNGAAPRHADWRAAALANPAVLAGWLGAAAAAQDSASRRAWMLYATKKGLAGSNTDLTALLRRNQDDGSWFSWIELRHHWRSADLALQWQRAHGSAVTEYGLIPARQQLQLVGTWFF